MEPGGASLRWRLRGSADLDPGETVTPVLPVIGSSEVTEVAKGLGRLQPWLLC